MDRGPGGIRPRALKISTVSFLPCFLPPASCLLSVSPSRLERKAPHAAATGTLERPRVEDLDDRKTERVQPPRNATGNYRRALRRALRELPDRRAGRRPRHTGVDKGSDLERRKRHRLDQPESTSAEERDPELHVHGGDLAA